MYYQNTYKVNMCVCEQIYVLFRTLILIYYYYFYRCYIDYDDNG